MVRIDKCKFYHRNKNRYYDFLYYKKNGVSYLLTYYKNIYINKKYRKRDKAVFGATWNFMIVRKQKRIGYNSIYDEWKLMSDKHKQIAEEMKNIYEETFLVFNKLGG